MKKLSLPALILLLAASAWPQQTHFVSDQAFQAIAREYSGERAQEHTRNITNYHRIQGSPMMTAVAEQVVLPALQAAGLEAKLEFFPSDGKTRYGTWISPMGWEMRGGELWVESAGAAGPDFEPYRLCRYSDVAMCISSYSQGGEWSGELVEVGPGTSAADYQGKDIRGKVALASGYAGDVVRHAVLRHGAVGVVIYPAAGDRPEHPHMVRYNGIWPRAEDLQTTRGGFQISRSQYEKLKQLMAAGPVRVRGSIDATLLPGRLTLVHAWIRGSDQPEREVILTAHLDHPKWSANDNASGSGALIEVAHTLQTLIASGKLAKPRYTLHLIWVPELYGTLAYLENHPETRACDAAGGQDPRFQGDASRPKGCTIANLNLDMVGEDTVKTNSQFYFTRTPDSVPSFLDALLADVMEQTRKAGLVAQNGSRNLWTPESRPYAMGSDHDAFLGVGISASMLGHWPDWTHHTSQDTVEKTDATEFFRVGTMAAAAAWWMAAADPSEWKKLEFAEQASRIQISSDKLAHLMTHGRRSPAVAAAAEIHLDRLRETVSGLEAGTAFYLSGDGGMISSAHRREQHSGPRLRVLLPLASRELDQLLGSDAKWLAEQRHRFSGSSLAGDVDFEILLFEAMNFMDGKHPTARIADLLAAEFLAEIDQAWVDHLVSILAAQRLVER